MNNLLKYEFNVLKKNINRQITSAHKICISVCNENITFLNTQRNILLADNVISITVLYRQLCKWYKKILLYRYKHVRKYKKRIIFDIFTHGDFLLLANDIKINIDIDVDVDVYLNILYRILITYLNRY